MEVQYLEEPTSDYLRAAVNTVLSIHDEVLLLSGHLKAFINSFSVITSPHLLWKLPGLMQRRMLCYLLLEYFTFKEFCFLSQRFLMFIHLCSKSSMIQHSLYLAAVYIPFSKHYKGFCIS